MSTENSTDGRSSFGLPIKPIPGSYGLPLLSPLQDRLDFYYFQGHAAYFQSRISKYKSTVFRVNVLPGLFMASDPRVVAVLDAKSFALLFDQSLVEKTDVLTGTYVPSAALIGGYCPLAYLDPSDPATPPSSISSSTSSPPAGPASSPPSAPLTPLSSTPSMPPLPTPALPTSIPSKRPPPWTSSAISSSAVPPPPPPLTRRPSSGSSSSPIPSSPSAFPSSLKSYSSTPSPSPIPCSLGLQGPL